MAQEATDPVLINEPRLMAWLGIDSRSKLKRWLKRNGIRTFTGEGGSVAVIVDDLKAREGASDEVEF